MSRSIDNFNSRDAVLERAATHREYVQISWACRRGGARRMDRSQPTKNSTPGDRFHASTQRLLFHNSIPARNHLPKKFHLNSPSSLFLNRSFLLLLVVIYLFFFFYMEGRHRRAVAREFVLLLLLELSASGFSATAVYGGGGVGFVRRDGTQFVVDAGDGGRRPLEGINGFNAYWLMYLASFPEERWKVHAAFREAAAHGLTVVRTWAFRDGGFRALQASPGVYNEDVFQGLDYVISEANKFKIRLILSLVNNFDSFGGRRQYIEWAREAAGHCLSSDDDDDFYTDDVVKDYYKNHVKAILTRVNTINGLSYKDDPSIFAWELINEPRCVSDLSGITLQGWIEEMAAYVKSIDENHMLEVGLEGFYGESTPERKKFNLVYDMGTDFISNNLVKGIDFATLHVYPDEWMPGSTNQTQMAFLDGWLRSHIADADAVLSMPLLVSEFGKKHSPAAAASSSSSSNRRRRQRDAVADERQSVYASVYDAVYASASGGGACRGGLFWQLLLGEEAMDDMRDGYEVVFSESPFLEHLIDMQSRRLNDLSDKHPSLIGSYVLNSIDSLQI